MALLNDQEVQLRISARAEGGAGVDALTTSVDDLQKELEAVAEAAQKSGAAQAEATAKLAIAKTRMDDVKLSLASAKNEYKFLAERAKESGVGQSIFAAQAAYAKTKVAELTTDLRVASGTLKLASEAHRNAARETKAHADEQQRLADRIKSLDLDTPAKGVGQLGSAFSSLNGVLGTLGIGAVGQKFLDANLAADKLQKSLQAVNGDAGKTAADLEFLKETAQRLGINLESSSAAFVKLAAASKGTSLEGQATRDIFTSIGGAMSQLGLSSAETERAFAAIGQMMSKGTVSAEELKGQLGDVLPGALSIAARATGLTTQELGKLMETGGLLAEDFLPKFAAEIKKSFGGAEGDIQGLSNTIERVKNVWNQAFKILGNTGVMNALAAALGVVNEAFLILATGVTAVVSGFFAFGKATTAIGIAVATLDFSHLTENLSAIGTEMVGNVEKMARLTGTSKLVATAMDGVAEATQKSTTAAQGSGVGWEKLVVAYDQSAKSAADYVEQTKKVVKANDDQANLLVKLATLSGNENELMRAKEEAARQAAASSSALAQAIDAEAKTLQAKVIALQEEIKGQQNVSVEKLKSIEEAKKSADAKMEEAKSSLANAAASRAAAAAAEIESEARYDNSLRVSELKAAYEQAAIKVDILKAAQASGINVSAELTVAQTAAAKAAALHKDAIADQTVKIAANLAAKKGQISVEQAGIQLSIEIQKGIMQNARARGDEAGAALAGVEIKRLEIQMAQLVAKAKMAEAEASRLLAIAKIEELRTSGPMTEAKEAEIRALQSSVKVKEIEAQIAGVTAKSLEELTWATRASSDAASGSTGGYNQMAGAMNNAADAADRLNASQRAGGGVKGADGITRNAAGQHVSDSGEVLKDKNGNPITNSTSLLDMGNQTDKSVDVASLMYKRDRNATAKEIEAAQKYYGELYARGAATKLTGNLGTQANATRLTNIVANEAIDQALQLARKELSTGQAIDLGTSVGELTKQNIARTNWRNQVTDAGGQSSLRNAYKNAGNDAAEQTQRALTTVNINLNGQKVQVTADSKNTKALTDLFRAIESDAARAF